uniref:Probable ATP-dependent RNA helicase ddx56 n=1 Tax=Cicer arietinum TaxID=3827 RepID=A0A1S3DXJ5_CICAR|nr:probable ATP-dependent RNA helicase ddx56 [Cicer arietinum]
MGCGKSKHDVASGNTTTLHRKKSSVTFKEEQESKTQTSDVNNNVDNNVSSFVEMEEKENEVGVEKGNKKDEVNDVEDEVINVKDEEKTNDEEKKEDDVVEGTSDEVEKNDDTLIKNNDEKINYAEETVAIFITELEILIRHCQKANI